MNLELRKSGTDLGQRDLTERIIGAAIQVHRELGPGYLEGFYEQALAIQREEDKLIFERQKLVPVLYRGKTIGEHRLDLLVENAVVVELKAVSELQDIFFSVVRSYMKALNVHNGLLLNFAAMPLTIKRVGREQSCS